MEHGNEDHGQSCLVYRIIVTAAICIVGTVMTVNEYLEESEEYGMDYV